MPIPKRSAWKVAAWTCLLVPVLLLPAFGVRHVRLSAYLRESKPPTLNWEWPPQAGKRLVADTGAARRHTCPPMDLPGVGPVIVDNQDAIRALGERSIEPDEGLPWVQYNAINQKSRNYRILAMSMEPAGVPWALVATKSLQHPESKAGPITFGPRTKPPQPALYRWTNERSWEHVASLDEAAGDEVLEPICFTAAGNPLLCMRDRKGKYFDAANLLLWDRRNRGWETVPVLPYRLGGMATSPSLGVVAQVGRGILVLQVHPAPSWKRLEVEPAGGPKGLDVNRISVGNDGSIWVYGYITGTPKGASILLRTLDAGRTWERIPFPALPDGKDWDQYPEYFKAFDGGTCVLQQNGSLQRLEGGEWRGWPGVSKMKLCGVLRDPDNILVPVIEQFSTPERDEQIHQRQLAMAEQEQAIAETRKADDGQIAGSGILLGFGVVFLFALRSETAKGFLLAVGFWLFYFLGWSFLNWCSRWLSLLKHAH